MDQHIKEFYCQYSDEKPRGNFHKVISLNETPDYNWDTVKKKVPGICKGWYELAHLTPKDRIEFYRDFWSMKLPYHRKLQESIDRFFESLDDIVIYITQRKFDDPFEAHLVYSLKDNTGFYSGNISATEEELANLQGLFPNYIFPNDYQAFLQIHNGFSKTTDSTGIIRTDLVRESYRRLQKQINDSKNKEGLRTTAGKPISDPRSLIPFYESFGMPFYQCFWGEWYPETEMGNVYYSGEYNTISDVSSSEKGPETLAFPSFSEWLMFYLEKVE